MARRMRQAALAVRTGTPGVVHAARICAEKAASMHGQDLQVRMTFEHAVENQIVKRQRRLQWVADDIVEVETGEALALSKSVRMDDDESTELFGLGPERREGGVGELTSADVCEDLRSLQSKPPHSPLKL